MLTSIIMDKDKDRQDKEDKEVLLAIVSLAVLGKPVAIRSLRTYLTRPDLPGNPRTNSAWTHMRAVGNDRAFVTVMGIDVQTFEEILVPFDLAWNGTPIPRGDVIPNGAPQPYRQSLDSAGGLALLLHWLSSTMALPALTGRTRQFERCSNSRVRPVVGQALSDRSTCRRVGQACPISSWDRLHRTSRDRSDKSVRPVGSRFGRTVSSEHRSNTAVRAPLEQPCSTG
ncbi:hypothetical protein PCANC_07918 [Puccinia coronata f. sp. avenae]|uniref:Uncharacterized protein n=1 Tax=Puccinia coronata f. sp. avenae TaxID=200324 RepID=A0A2N5UY98_9BASI|nr:hypothetical protein PCANC_07918 [Puccinia coronata f. sp. avenae]